MLVLMLADNDIQVLALADNPSHSDLLMSLWVDTWTVRGLCRRGTRVGGYGLVGGQHCILRD